MLVYFYIFQNVSICKLEMAELNSEKLNTIASQWKILLKGLLTCLTEWDLLNSSGAEILRQIEGNLDATRSSSTSLQVILSKLKIQLDSMYSTYDECLATLQVIPALLIDMQSTQSVSNIDLPSPFSKIVSSLQAYLDKYDQEYMLKETIVSCLTSAIKEPSYVTNNHVSGFLAIWTVQPYIDMRIGDELNEIMNEFN